MVIPPEAADATASVKAVGKTLNRAMFLTQLSRMRPPDFVAAARRAERPINASSNESPTPEPQARPENILHLPQ
jgi:hypothetical protein